MVWFLRPPLRSNNGGTVPTLSSAFVTVLGLRVTRTQVLRVSGLLALRSLSNAIDIPLDDSVVAYLWNFLFSSAQAGVALATAASIFDFGGLFGRAVSRIFPSSVDGPFLQLYATLILIAGPLVACLETAVIVYEIMNIFRSAEEAMFEAENSGNRLARPAMLTAGLLSVSGTVVIAVTCARLAPDFALIGAAPIGVAAVAILATSACLDSANVVEAGFISLYVAVLWAIALTEEISIGAPLLPILRSRALSSWAAADDVRAGLMITSLSTLLLSMGRAERFVKLLAKGHDAMAMEEAREGDLHMGSTEEQAPDSANVQTDGQIQHVSRVQSRAKKSQMRPVISTATLLAATFRVLFWAGQIKKGEYVPLAIRGWQVVMSFVFYLFYSRL